MIIVLLLLLVTSSTCSGYWQSQSPTANSRDHNCSDSSLVTCPAWFVRDSSDSCRCAENIEPGFVTCDSTTNNTILSNELCITYDEVNDTVYAGFCPYNALPKNKVFSLFTVLAPWTNVSQLNEAMCGPLNRTGLLCSQCQEGLGPAVLSYSRECVECLDSAYGWLVYLTAALLPTTLLCVVIIMFRFEATSPSMNTFIFLCQMYTTAITFPTNNNVVLETQMDTSSKYFVALITFYGMWNLEFFRGVLPPFCISSNMNTLQVMALDFVVAIYPLILTALVYYCIEFHDKGYRVLVLLWKPFHRYFVRFRRTWNVKGSVINTFATFVLLSYSHLLTVSYALLLPVIVQTSNGNTLNRPLMFLDTSVVLFGRSHIPYAVLSFAVILFFILIPLMFILFYQNRFFRKFLKVCRLENALMSELVKVFQKSYKNGIDGSRDLRWFAGVNLLLRGIYCFVVFPVNANFQIAVSFSQQLLIVASGLTAMLCAILRPHQKMLYNLIDTILFAISCYTFMYLTISETAPQLNMSPIPLAIGGLLPLVYFVCLVAYKLIRNIRSLKWCQKLFMEAGCLKRKHQDQENERTPDRLMNSSEYTPLLPPGEPVAVTSIDILNY